MDSAFFIASKLIWAALRPDSLLMLILIASWLMLRRRPGLSRFLLGGGVAGMILLAVLPVQSLLLTPLEARYRVPAPPRQVDGILVLGGAEHPSGPQAHGQVALNAAAERLTEALALARRYPDAPVIFSGGSGLLRGGMSGADLAARLFGDLGLPPDRLLLEGASRNTAENARMTRALVNPLPGQRWLLVTSAYHMPRSVAAFCAAGWTGIVPWPVDFRAKALRPDWDLTDNAFDLTVAWREWIGLLAYDLTGQATAPGPDCLAPQD